MKKILILALLAINAYAACNTNGKSALFKEWKEQWGEYKWGEDAQINQYSVVETNGAFKDMIRTCDMVGLQQMLSTLGKEQILANQEAQGSFLYIILDEDINHLSVEFLLDNGLINSFNPLTSTAEEVKEYKQLAKKKLDEAKVSQNEKAIKNYEKILEFLESYSNKE